MLRLSTTCCSVPTLIGFRDGAVVLRETGFSGRSPPEDAPRAHDRLSHCRTDPRRRQAARTRPAGGVPDDVAVMVAELHGSGDPPA